MPSIIQRGKAKITGLPGNLTLFANAAIQTARAQHAWVAANVMDGNGFELAWDARNSHIILEVNFKLTASSLSQAKGYAAFLAEYAEVAMSGFDLDWINPTGVGGFYTGSWCYFEGGSIDLANEQVGGHQIRVRKFKDPTQNALQFAVPA